MKSIYYFIILSVWAMLTVCCSSEELIQTPVKVGEEVQFGLSLDKETRTIYGDKNTDENALPIYWVNGDKVNVYSPQCIEGRNFAEYEVSVTKLNQNFADALTKTGESGLQWGETPANFYSIYPSGNYTIVGDEIQGLKISSSQDVYLAADGKTLKNMSDCLMYAVAKKCSVNPVKLTYRPIATSFMVNLTLSDNNNGTSDKLIIQSVRLTASDKNIAGTFNANLLTGAFERWENGENIVNVQISNSSTGGFFEMQEGDKVSIPIFIVPDVESESTKDWIIEIVTDKGTFKKTLNKTTDGISNGLTLAPGKVHELTLPGLTIKNSEWNVNNWMVNIPRNVYLSEVSIPGSWNSLNEDSQGKKENYTNISTQYSKGIRAFHLDTRWKRSGSYNKYTYELGVAIGGSGNTTSGDNKYMTAGATFKEALEEIILNLKNDEYMVVICTFAQNSAEHNGSDGWVQAISDICADKAEVYDAKMLKSSTVVGDVLNKVIVIINMQGAFTTVPSNSKCLFVNYPMEVTRDLFPKTLTDVLMGPIYSSALNSTSIKDTGISIYRSHSQICFNEDSYEYTNPADSERDNVDNRGFLPTRGERKTVANNILNWSKENYGKEDYNHDKWIYLGLGGYYFTRKSNLFGAWYSLDEDNNSHDDVASYYNPWINGKVTEMGTTPVGQTTPIPYYPVGIVLMNYVNDYSSTAKNILLLNNKYRLQYDSDKPADYNPNQLNASSYDANLTTGGNLISLDK